MARGVQVVDISDPARPLPRAHYNTPGYVKRIDVAGDMLYVTDEGAGLEILKLAPLPSISAAIAPDGGTLVSSADATRYTFATDTFTSTAIVTHTLHFSDAIPATGSLAGGHAFDVLAHDSATGQRIQPTKPYSITIQYSDSERGPAIEFDPGALFLGWQPLDHGSPAARSTGPHTLSAPHPAISRSGLYWAKLSTRFFRQYDGDCSRRPRCDSSSFAGFSRSRSC